MTRGILGKGVIIYTATIEGTTEEQIVIRRDDRKKIRNPIKGNLESLGFFVDGNEAAIKLNDANAKKAYEFMITTRFSTVHDERLQNIFRSV